MIEDLWNVYQTIDDPDGLTLSDVAAFLDSIGA